MAEQDEEKKESKKKAFSEGELTADAKDHFEYVKKRIGELQDARKDVQYGVYLENIWADADKDYSPHRLRTRGGMQGKKVIATDEEKGWRGQVVQLGSSDWQSDISQPNPYIKIQVALSVLIDQNPSGVFMAASKKFQATNELIKQLYQRSWEVAKSKQQLKLFTFNLAKYGWAVGRTYPLRLSNNVRAVVSYDPENPENTQYENREVVEYNDIMRDNLDVWNVWIDDMAKPNNDRSVNDWCWRKVYSRDQAEQEFGKYKNWKKYAIPEGTTTEKVSGTSTAGQGSPSKKYTNKELVEVYFYENRSKDLFYVTAGGVPIVDEPLPISDAKGIKKLSLWQAYWNLRHAESPYGIGIYEAIRYDQAALDRIRNMSLDQLTLSIYKMFFYQGTQNIMETGDIRITPGIGKQVLDPKNITWLEVPGPGREAVEWKAMLKDDLDEASGVTNPLLGVIEGKTAFETAQAKEAALKRLKNPLENITEALNVDAYITISIIQLLYSIPEVYSIADPALIDSYLQEVQGDPDLYERDEAGNFNAKVYPEFPLNLDKDENGSLISTEDTRFFRVKPKFLTWEGVINVKSQSVLTPSKQMEKVLDLEMYNMIIPLLIQPPQIYSKVAKNIVKLYDKDPKDVLPDIWLQAPSEPLFVPTQDVLTQALAGQNGQSTPSAPSAFPSPAPTAPRSPTQNPGQGVIGKFMSKINPFR